MFIFVLIVSVAGSACYSVFVLRKMVSIVALIKMLNKKEDKGHNRTGGEK
jgi:hypothetical protein